MISRYLRWLRTEKQIGTASDAFVICFAWGWAQVRAYVDMDGDIPPDYEVMADEVF